MSDLSKQIATAQEPERRTATDLIESMRGEFVKALPAHVSVDHFMRLALTELRSSPQLAECSAESLLGALMLGARTGLEVGGPLGELYLTPRALTDRATGKRTWTVVPIIGYRGLIKLARNTGKVGAIDAELVREGDRFEMGFDLARGGKFVEWTPADFAEDRPVIGVLAHAELIGAGVQFRYLPIEKVIERKKRGAAGDRGPWATDLDAMIRKTGLRHLSSVLPQSTALVDALKADEQVQVYRVGDVTGPRPALEDGES